MLHNAMGVGGLRVSADQRYEGVWSNGISISRGGGFQFPEQKSYVNLAIPLPCFPQV